MEVEPPLVKYNRTWHMTYIETLLPFDLIMRFMTCNKPDTISPQCRIMRFESYKTDNSGGLWSKMEFNRTDARALAQQLKWILPLTIHITDLLPLYLEPSTADNKAMLINKRRAGDEEGVSPLINESRHRDFVHFIRPCKELVFDLDVSDFDRFCDCVSKGEQHNDDDEEGKMKKTLCHCCWLHIEGAYFILQFMLTHLFGYKSENLLNVFSGGKGIHCFVNDARSLSMNEEQRLFLYDTMYIGSGKTDDGSALALCTWIHKFATPRLTRTLEKLFMSQVITSRNLFATSPAFRQRVEDILSRYYPATYNNLIKTSAWQKTTTKSSIIWSLLKSFEIYDYHAQAMAKPSLFIIYRLYYPIIDKEPLKMKHSIKLPFSIHTTTKNIALPIDRTFIESTNKEEQLVTLCDVYTSHFNMQPLPALFANGINLLGRWLDMYQ